VSQKQEQLKQELLNQEQKQEELVVLSGGREDKAAAGS
jgi:hypothetical protein